MSSFPGDIAPSPADAGLVPLTTAIALTGLCCSAVELKDNTVIVVLGASGDLAKKKTFPALFGLVCAAVAGDRTR